MDRCGPFLCYLKTNETFKGLDVISGVELDFGGSLTGAINMKSKDISIHHIMCQIQCVQCYGIDSYSGQWNRLTGVNLDVTADGSIKVRCVGIYSLSHSSKFNKK